MSDETDVMGEVARVLLVHASFKASQGIQEPDAPWWWECDGCDTKVARGGTGRNDTFSGLAAHQADLLAEAGLLREFPGRVDSAGGGETSNNSEGQVGVSLEQPQGATQEPAGATQGGSGDSGTSDTLSARLRAAADYQDRPGAYDELRAMADEVHRLEVHARVVEQSLRRARAEGDEARAQVEAIRAAITREAAHGDAITRCNLVAERFQTVLDSVEPVTIAPTPTENPFRMPEDRA